MGWNVGFYIRKSISAGPFRFNLSKSGVGLSVGVRGLRFGTGPRGNYVRAGIGGFYYSQSLGPARRSSPSRSRNLESSELSQSQPRPRVVSDDVQMIEIESGLVQRMTDSSARHVIDQINENHKKVRLSRLLSIPFIAISAVAFFTLPSGAKRIAAAQAVTPKVDNLHPIISHAISSNIGPMHWGAIAIFAVAVVGWMIGRWFDNFRRATVLFYDFDADVLSYYENFVTAFNNLCGCDGVWHLQSSGKIDNLTQWKRNAGASALVTRKQITGRLGLPSALKCNIDVPMLPLRNRAMYFFPDFVLMVEGKNVGGINYENLKTKVEQSSFIETGRVPKDAEILSKTWLHPNKKGGPDKRFASNRQYPVCDYESILFETQSGLLEQIQYSKRGLGKEFDQALDYLCFANDPASKANGTI